jgi:hypothetical protein
MQRRQVEHAIRAQEMQCAGIGTEHANDGLKARRCIVPRKNVTVDFSHEKPSL